MSSPTNAEMMNMAFMGQENYIPAAEEARPHTFLSLAPTTSASYPVNPITKSPVPKSPVQAPTDPTAAAATQATTPAVPAPSALEEALKTRRSSSLSSDASGKRRFLKLGPVHFGEGDGNGDWSEDVLAE
jgi:hypothetical protein